MVRADDPLFELLSAAHAYNRRQQSSRGGRGSKLPSTLDFNTSGCVASVPMAELWAALRRHGGHYLVRAYGCMGACVWCWWWGAL